MLFIVSQVALDTTGPEGVSVSVFARRRRRSASAAGASLPELSQRARDRRALRPLRRRPAGRSMTPRLSSGQADGRSRDPGRTHPPRARRSSLPQPTPAAIRSPSRRAAGQPARSHRDRHDRRASTSSRSSWSRRRSRSTTKHVVIPEPARLHARAEHGRGLRPAERGGLSLQVGGDDRHRHAGAGRDLALRAAARRRTRSCRATGSRSSSAARSAT